MEQKAILSIPHFDEIPVSTKTFICVVNVVFNIQQLLQCLPTVTVDRTQFNLLDYPTGTIVTLDYKHEIRGIDLKARKKKKKKKENDNNNHNNNNSTKKWFRNSFTVVMIVDNKLINFKLCQNGIFQITGCKTKEHAISCVFHIWNHITKQQNSADLYTQKQTEDMNFQVLVIPAMRNINFSVGFKIDREKLSKYIHYSTDFSSLLETSFGYTGVNIKFPILIDQMQTLQLTRLIFNGFNDTTYVNETTTYGDYLNTLPKEIKQKKTNKTRFNTFLVFHSGKIIMSGITAKFMRPTYNMFVDIVKKKYELIKEKINDIQQ